eukprot:scaffold44098_cov24-Tisochrysis_lutea.AAC.1
MEHAHMGSGACGIGFYAGIAQDTHGFKFIARGGRGGEFPQNDISYMKTLNFPTDGQEHNVLIEKR